MIKRAVVGGVAVLGVLALAGCSGEVTAADAYTVGCPAVDAVSQGGTVAGDASIKGLDALYASRVLGDEAQAWLGDAIGFLKSGDADALPSDVRQRIVSGCADHGQTLTHFSA